MPEKKESALPTVILAIVTLAIGLSAVAYGLQTLFYFQARQWARGAPLLWETPQPMPSVAASQAQEKNLLFYGMVFDAPWKGIAAQKNGDARSEVSFSAGPVVIFFSPQGEKDILSTMQNGDLNTYHRYQDIFGANLLPSNYDLYLAVYSASPASVSPFMSRDQMLRVGTLLEWKLAFAANEASAIYTVQAGGMRGLQFGDPSRDAMIVERLFDTHNGQYRLLFTSKAGRGTFSQSDINCVIDSLQPEPHPH
jgi:hypothetical protein